MLPNQLWREQRVFVNRNDDLPIEMICYNIDNKINDSKEYSYSVAQSIVKEARRVEN